MSAAHTPGPWKAVSEAACEEIEVMEIAEVSHMRVIPAAGGWPIAGTPEADARLIAAAPLMLEKAWALIEKLEALRGSIDNDWTQVNQADVELRRVLAIAEGEQE